jgi:uncharacterized protein YqgC (DUF456 family)
MSTGAEVVFGVLLAVGLVGVVVPVLPGLALIGGVAVVWAIVEGTSTAWAVAVAMIGVLAIGTYLKYRIPGRELQAQDVPASTWALAAIGGIVGFFVIPVVGAPVGLVLGVFVGERRRFGGTAPAWASTKRLVISIGKGMLLELAAAVVAIGIWVGAVVVA